MSESLAHYHSFLSRVYYFLRDTSYHNRHPLWSFFESLVVTALIIGIMFIFEPQDPLSIAGSFPWFIFGPMMVALRYGVGYGLGSCVVVLLSFVFVEPHSLLEQINFGFLVLGTISVVMLCGQFSSVWNLRVRRADLLNIYAQERLDNLSRAYYMTRISHDQLEQNLISRPMTLRNAITDLRKIVDQTHGVINETCAKQFLVIISQLSSIDSAAVYVGSKLSNLQLAASIGQHFNLDSKDPLVASCFSDNNMQYYSINDLRKTDQSAYLAVFPLVASDKTILGILVIKDMSFWTLNVDVLQSLSVVCSYVANEVWASKQGEKVLEVFPDCSPHFARELYRLLAIRQQVKVESQLVVLIAGDEENRSNVMVSLKRQQRGLDFTWSHIYKQYECLFTLMPFATPSGAAGYIKRISVWLRNEFGIKLGSDNFYVRATQVLPNLTPVQLLQKLFKEIDQIGRA